MTPSWCGERRARPRWCGWPRASCGARTPWGARRARDASSSPTDDWSCTCGFRRPVPDAELRGDVLVTADGRRLPVRLALPGTVQPRQRGHGRGGRRGHWASTRPTALAAMAVGRRRRGEVRHRRLGRDERPSPAGQEPGGMGRAPRPARGRNRPGRDRDQRPHRRRPRPVVAVGRALRAAGGASGGGHGGAVSRPGRATAPRRRGPRHGSRRSRRRCAAAGIVAVEYVGNYTAFQALRRHLVQPPRAPGPARSDTSAAVSATAAPGMPVAVTVVGAGAGAGAACRRRARSRSSGPSALRVVVVHPDLLGTYGDGGNGQVLAGRAVWRDIPVELVHAPSDAAAACRRRRLLPRRWRGRAPGAVGGATARRGARRRGRRRRRGLGGVRRLPGDRAVVPGCRRATASRGGAPRRGHGEGPGRRAVGELVAEPMPASDGWRAPATRWRSRR